MVTIKLPNGRKWEKVVKMFYGQYENKLDEKNRLVIPKKLREEAGDKLFILEYLDGKLALFKPEGFEELVKKVSSIPFEQAKARLFARKIIGSAIDLDVDKMGRVQIPLIYVKKRNLQKELVILGVGDHIEIWNQQDYYEYEKAVDENFDNVAEELFSK